MASTGLAWESNIGGYQSAQDLHKYREGRAQVFGGHSALLEDDLGLGGNPTRNGGRFIC